MIKPRDYQTKAIQEVFIALKKNDDPVLLYSSVGSGKSLICAFICKQFEQLNKRVLCLVNSSELVRNNSDAFKSIDGNPSVFCASLLDKSYSNNIVFATPQSVIAAIKSNHPIKSIVFNMIIVDEADNIAFKNHDSIFMRILRHYKQEYQPMRLLGMTGTPFRSDNGKTESIVGEHGLFKSVVGNITTEWLIENNYLAKPSFGLKHVDSIDMTSYHIEKSVKNKQNALSNIVTKNKRLTWEILQEVNKIMTHRNGAFIFCSSIAHCYEAVEALPLGSSRLIIGSTKENERNEILTLARNKEIKYLVSVSCLLVGIDVPYFCTTVFLRPTQSLRIFLQAIGRSLRLHREKKDALILDYAQNLDRFQDIDHPIINEALQARRDDEEEDKPFTCYTCGEMAGLHTRRCHGMVAGKRCDYFFQFKTCTDCNVQSDITARACRGCGRELIDPNAKLTRLKAETFTLDVIGTELKVVPQGYTSNPIINATYKCVQGYVHESYYSNSEKNKNILYAKFVRLHIDKASDYYMHLQNINKMRDMISEPGFKCPKQLVCTRNEDGFYKIVKKVFD